MSVAVELWQERWNPLQKRAADGTWGDGAGRFLGDGGTVHIGHDEDGNVDLGIGAGGFTGDPVEDDDDSGDLFGHTARLTPAATRELHARLTAATADGKRRQAAADKEWEEHGTVPDHGDDFEIASGYVSGEGADVHYSVILDDYSVGVQTYLGAIPHSSDATLMDLWGAEQAAEFDAAETRKLLARLATAAGATESTALDLWRALEAWDAARHPRGPGGKFIKGGGSGGNGGGGSKPSLADAVRGTAAGGPKRQRDDKGGMSVADAVRSAARRSDTTGTPTQRTPAEHRAEGAHSVADEVERVLADASIPDSLREEIVGRARAIADSHGKKQPKGGTSRLSEQSTQDLKKWLEMYGTERPRSKQIMRELDRRRTGQSGTAPPKPVARPRRPDDPAATAAKLNSAASLDEARSHLDGLTMTQLRQVAIQAGVVYGSGDNKARVVDRLVNSTAGRRLDSEAIGRMVNR